MKLSLITATHRRSHLLETRALPSILNQSDSEFEWIVINDGRDAKTRELIQPFTTVIYREIDHSETGFGLCIARNLGLSVATGEIVAYLDDDNAIAPQFVAEIKAFFQQSSQIRCCMVQQERRRNIVQNGELIKQGKSFISPDANSTVSDFIQHKALFDSNGFAHLRENAPSWNPDYRVFADYEYFLQCLDRWKQFCIFPSVLVDYVQTSEGVIGRSTYEEWATELSNLLQHKGLMDVDRQILNQFIEKWQNKSTQSISAFNH
ncbi:hypothetical protein LEP3755_08900 [Leptolyngbya sp. NIES-3755]|nr:hypothetical protein LEP3755_08900 [Leptolyngbya sp. NIES-3755]